MEITILCHSSRILITLYEVPVFRASLDNVVDSFPDGTPPMNNLPRVLLVKKLPLPQCCSTTIRPRSIKTFLAMNMNGVSIHLHCVSELF